LFGNDDIHNEAHYVASNNLIFLNAEFVCIASINISHLSGAETVFGQGREQSQKIWVSFCPKSA